MSQNARKPHRAPASRRSPTVAKRGLSARGLVLAVALAAAVVAAAMALRDQEPVTPPGEASALLAPALRANPAVDPPLARPRPRPPLASDTPTASDSAPSTASTPLDRDQLRAALEQFLAQRTDSVPLRSGDLEALIDALERARIAYAEIDALGAAPEHADRVAALRGDAERSHDEARRIAGLDPGLAAVVGGALGRSARPGGP